MFGIHQLSRILGMMGRGRDDDDIDEDVKTNVVGDNKEKWHPIIEDNEKSIFAKLLKVDQRNTYNTEHKQSIKLKQNMKQRLIKRVVQQNKNEEKEEGKRDLDEEDQIRIRRLSMISLEDESQFYNTMVPNKFYKQVPFCDSRAYGGKFTSRGNLYYCSSQESIMLFNTSDPYNWVQKKKIYAQDVNWTVTDMDICANEQYLIYSTMGPIVRLLDLETLCKKSERINFSLDQESYYGSAIMSCKFSGDSREIVAATKQGEVLVYDLISNRVITRVLDAHQDEINSVCFANRQMSNVIFTGSDDCFIKIWDRRAFGNGLFQGAFVGHCEGITQVASKGDGIYVASNGKDQLLKVWDIRKMVTPDELRRMPPIRTTNFDYRWQRYNRFNQLQKHSMDRSLFSFQGHEVLQTLIRCQFSPMETTGQRYVYSGSANGKIPIYDLLTGEKVQELNDRRAQVCCRDISWHPHYPVLASTSFNGNINVWTHQNETEEESKQSVSSGNSHKTGGNHQEMSEQDIFLRTILSQLRARTQTQEYEYESLNEEEEEHDKANTDQAEDEWQDDEEDEESQNP